MRGLDRQEGVCGVITTVTRPQLSPSLKKGPEHRNIAVILIRFVNPLVYFELFGMKRSNVSERHPKRLHQCYATHGAIPEPRAGK